MGRVTSLPTVHLPADCVCVYACVQVLDDSRKWWRARNRRGVAAHVPHTIVAPAFSPPGSPQPARSPPHLYPNPIYTMYQVPISLSISLIIVKK